MKSKFYWLTILLLVFSNLLSAQDIPVDKSVKIGTLENGMKYYIKHNPKPEEKVELRLVINAGSILEDDDQQGLAHFMEHMNFNGLKHFPDNELVDFLQSIGVKFGQHLNAYTSFDETVYMLPVPLDKPENLKSGLDVIEDWAFNATLSGDQIDKERGVVLEELRLGLGPDKRMMDKYLPKILYKSRYAERLPIGKKDLLETFSYDKIRRFHKDWYRPNLMAVIVVGDINVDEIEKDIINRFSKYENPDNERTRETFDTPIHKETLVSIESDPDASYSRAMILYKDTKKSKEVKTIDQYNQDLINTVYSSLMSNRIKELINSNTPPFTYGMIGYYGGYARNTKALQGIAVTEAGEQLEGLKVLVREIERAKRFGFTQQELDRVKSEILARLERQKNNKNKTESRQYTEEYKRNFLEGEPIPGIEWEYDHFKDYAPKISLNDVNDLAKRLVKEENRVVIITGPDKKEITQPTEEEVLSVFNEDNFADLKPYESKALITELVENIESKGKIVKTEENKKVGTTTLTLSNGVKVTYKKTNFKDDEILFNAVSLGGTSVLDDETFKNTTFAYDALGAAGLNSYSLSDIQKYLSGKQVSVEPYVSKLTEGLKGSSSQKDFKVLMELIYSYFTGLNKSEENFNAYKQKQSAVYNNILSNPQFYFANETNKFLNSNNPRTTNLVPIGDDWDNTDYNKAYDIYNKKFSDADDFHFYFVGNIDDQEMKKYAEKYLASLPKITDEENFVDNNYRSITGNHNKTFKKGKDPKSNVTILMNGEAEYNEQDDIALQAFGDITTIKIIEQLREDEGGIYGGGAYGGMSKNPYGSYHFAIQFPCGPENAESLTKSALTELDKLIKNGPDQKDLDKYKKGEINDLNTKLETNNYWLRFFVNQYVNGESMEDILSQKEKINALTVDDVKSAGQKYLTDQRIVFTLMPEDGWEKEIKKEESKKSDVSPKEVIENYINALGGRKKLESVNTLSMETSLNMSGMIIKGKTLKMAPNKVRNEQEVMGNKMLQVFDGEKGYMEQAGNKMPLPQESINNLKDAKIFEALSYDVEKFESVEEANIDGEEYYVLVDKDGKSYFNKKTGLLHKMIDNTNNSETIFLEYKTIKGIQFPTKMKTSANGQNMEIEISNIKINKGVSEDDFK